MKALSHYIVMRRRPVKGILMLSLGVFLAFASICEALNQKQLTEIELKKKKVFELFNKEVYKESIPILEDILSIHPSDETASLYLILARRRLVEHLCKNADAAFVKNDYDKAINEWGKLLNVYPGDFRAEKMVEYTRNLMRTNILESMYTHMEDFLKKGDYESAVNELEKILVVNPDNVRARELLIASRQAIANNKIKDYYNEADELYKNNKFDLAIETWGKILKIDKEQEAASRYIASARKTMLNAMYSDAKQQYESGQYTSARETYYKIMAENPTDQDIKKTIAKLNDIINVTQKIEGEGLATDMLRKAVKNHILADGNIKAAIAASRYATQLEPDNPLAHAIKDFMEIKYPSVYLSMEPPVRDMNIIDQYLFAALNHIYEGRYDLAIQESSIVIELQPENTLAYKRLGSAYFAIGKKDKAREAWEKALTMTPDDNELKQFIKKLY